MTNDYSTKPRSPLARGLSALRYISPFQLLNWRRHGFVVLRNFFGEEQIAAANQELDTLWCERNRPDNPLVIDVYGDSHRRKFLRDALDEDRNFVYKLNDVYLESELTRSLCLDPKLIQILSALNDGPPMICNSLHFERGSEQQLHFDTYYMPPPHGGRLIVTSICLEDVHPEAGPIVYVRGSQTMPPFIGARGDRTIVGRDELAEATAYAYANLDVEGNMQPFLGKRGDVLIWHEQLFHGGSPIVDHELTRRSLVTHYFRADNVFADRMQSFGNGFWLERPHPEIS
jgi:ectoine hydroxylase-related dioxygenase (phytanoyl-CoA dioxygenase family)